MSEELDKLLTESTGITLAVLKLQEQIPRIDKIKTEIQLQAEEIAKEIQNFQKQEQSDKEKFRQYINKSTEKLDSYVKDKLQIFKQSTDKINELLKNVDEKLEETLKIQDSIVKIRDEIVQENQNLLNNKPDSTNLTIDLIADYAAPHSITYLFNKYKNTDTPVIVRKIESTPNKQSMWSDNMCFYVKDIKMDKVIGDYYVDGVIENLEYPPNVTQPLYALYSNQKEINKIIKSK